MTAAAHLLATAPVPADTLVLEQRPLRPGAELASTSRFGDDVWLMSPAVFKRHQESMILNFETIPVRFRAAAKLLSFAMLTNDLPEGEDELSITTICSHLSALRAFLRWAHERGIDAVSMITATDLAAYQDQLLARRLSPGNRGKKRYVVRLLWLFRSKLDREALTFDPARLPGWDEATADPRRGENATDRIPEAVLGPVLGWALHWVNDFAADILDAQQEWARLHANTGNNMARRAAGSPGRVGDRLQQLLDRYRAEGRSLPGARRGVNMCHLAREIGCPPTNLYHVTRCTTLIAQTAEELGVSDDTYLRAEIRGRLDGQPWRGPIRYQEFPHLERLLQTACYIVVAYLSGMRDSEVKHLQRQCLSVAVDDTGRTYRRTVTSQAFKGEGSPMGVTATWIVGAPVEQAVDVLQRLQPCDQPYLFAVLPSSPHYLQSRVTEVKSSNQTRNDLTVFIDWLNDYCSEHERADRVPLVNGQRWRLVSTQFRRTLAWFIARRPGGTIAGAMQYRHQRVQMFEGYAGTSQSGFRAEVQAEEAIARGEHLLDIIDHNHQLTGPAAAEAHTRLEELNQHVGFHGKVVTDGKRLLRLLNRHDPHIYPGEYVTCVHNPDRALCHPAGGTRNRPSMGDCQPLRCRNVALTTANRTALSNHLARLDTTLTAGDHIAPLVRHRLQQRRAEIADFLIAHPPADQEAGR